MPVTLPEIREVALALPRTHEGVVAIDRAEMTELVTDAWSMVVPRKVLAAYLEERP